MDLILPDDILLKIFEHLDENTLDNVSLACHRMHDLVQAYFSSPKVRKQTPVMLKIVQTDKAIIFHSQRSYYGCGHNYYCYIGQEELGPEGSYVHHFAAEIFSLFASPGIEKKEKEILIRYDDSAELDVEYVMSMYPTTNHNTNMKTVPPQFIDRLDQAIARYAIAE
ncbi:hypothetical protein PMAYCL1PPCAC_21200, partial [Pristionchus mayeri]